MFSSDSRIESFVNMSVFKKLREIGTQIKKYYTLLVKYKISYGL